MNNFEEKLNKYAEVIVNWSKCAKRSESMDKLHN